MARSGAFPPAPEQPEGAAAPATLADVAALRSAVQRHWQALGINAEQIRARGLMLIAEPPELEGIGPDLFDRPQWMQPCAAQAWQRMRAAAAADGIELVLVSAFRSVDYQAGLLARKRARGQSLAQILAVNAPPGCSEHHSGCALDLASPGQQPLDEAFEHSAAYAWLQAHAADFGFRNSFPRGNPQGFVHEPWHWCHAAIAPLRLPI